MTDPASAVVLSNAHLLGDQRIARWVAGLRERGYAVRVVGLDEPSAGGPVELWGDSSVEVARLTPARRLGRLGRAVPLAFRYRGDVVVAIDPELFAVVSLAQRLRRGQSVIDVHEDFPTLAASRPTPATDRFGLVSPALVKVWAWGLAVAARFVTLSAAWGDMTVVADDHVRPIRAPFRVVGRNQPTTDDDASLAPLWRPDPGAALPVVYAGGLTAERGGFAMVEALSRSQGWTLDLYGPATPELADAISAAQRTHPGRLRWWGPIPNRALRKKLGEFAIGLCPLEANAAYEKALPAKITEYHHAGLGIVATDLPRIKQKTRDPQSALLVAPDANLASSLASALAALAVDADAVRALQAAARIHRETLDGAESLSEAIRQLPLGSRRGPRRGPIGQH